MRHIIQSFDWHIFIQIFVDRHNPKLLDGVVVLQSMSGINTLFTVLFIMQIKPFQCNRACGIVIQQAQIKYNE